MKINKPTITAFVTLFALVAVATAGSLTPPGIVASTMHSLANIWDTIASTSYDSSGISANQNGSLIQQLKYIENSTAWASGSNNIWNLNSGNVGIGTTTPDSQLEVIGNASVSQNFVVGGHTAMGQDASIDYSIFNGSARPAILSIYEQPTSNFETGINAELDLNPISGGAGATGVWAAVGTDFGNGQNFSNQQLVGGEFDVFHNTASPIGVLYGVNTNISSTGHADEVTGVNIQGGTDVGGAGELNGVKMLFTGNGGTISNLRGIYMQFPDSSIGTIIRASYFYGETPAHQTPAITDLYGLYLGDMSQAGAANDWNIYSLGANSKNYFGGRVGIGTIAPTAMLHVSSTSDGNIFKLTDSTGTCAFNPDAGSLGTTCSSDIRLKTDIIDAQHALDYLAGYHIRQYTIIASGKTTTGVIAQELLQTHPDQVSSSSDGYLSVQEPNPWILVKAIQELRDQATALSSQLFASIVREFKNVFGIGFEERRICLGDTCINEQQLRELLQRARVSAPAATQTPTPDISPIASDSFTPSPTASGSASLQ